MQVIMYRKLLFVRNFANSARGYYCRTPTANKLHRHKMSYACFHT